MLSAMDWAWDFSPIILSSERNSEALMAPFESLSKALKLSLKVSRSSCVNAEAYWKRK